MGQLCARLDGIPLAIELAAARLKALSVEQINARIGDMFRLLTGGSRTALPRQQTMKAAIDWSYDLLSEKEKVLLRRLSVFAGGWTLEAAEAVCADFGFRVPSGRLDFGLGAETPFSDQRSAVSADTTDLSAASQVLDAAPAGPNQNPKSEIQNAEVLDLLSSLVQKSLVAYEESEQGRGRYRLLEPMRQYGCERLVEAREAAVAQRQHFDFFVGLAEKAEPELFGAEEVEWLMRLEQEHDNLRAALAWAAEEDPALGLRLTGALWFFWQTHGHFVEGRERVETMLARTQGLRHTAARAKTLDGAGELAWHQGDYPAAGSRLDESIALWRELGDERGLAYALLHRGWVARAQGEQDLYHALHTESLSLFQKVGDPRGIASSSLGLGWMAQNQGKYVEAGILYEAARQVFREIRDRMGLAHALASLGALAQAQHSYPTARTYYEEGMALRREVGDKWAIARCLAMLGSLVTAQGDYETARPLLAESLTISLEIGNKANTCLALEHLAVLTAAQGQPERAARLFGAAAPLREAIAGPASPWERAEHDRCIAALRPVLGEAAFATAWAEGRTLTLEEAVRVALGEYKIPTTGGKDS